MEAATVAQDDGWRARAGWILTAVLPAVIVFGYLLPVTGWFSAVPGGLGDTRFNSVILEHLYRSLSGGPGVWNPEFFYPVAGVLAFSDNHFGTAATYLLVRALGLSREHAFDAWFMIGTLLNFPAAFYVIRRLGLSPVAAAFGAFFYTFCLPMIAWEGYAQLVHRFAIPFALLALWEMFERRRVADLARVAFFTVWQFYCSIYLGLFLVYLLVALGIALLVVRRPFAAAHWRANLAAERGSAKLAAAGVLIVSGLALAYLAATYYAISRAYGVGRLAGEITAHLPRLGSYLFAEASPFWRQVATSFFVPTWWEQQMFIGGGAFLLAIVGSVGALRGRVSSPALAKVMLIALLILFVGTLTADDLFAYEFFARYQGSLEAAFAVVLIPLGMLLYRLWRGGPPLSPALRAAWVTAVAVALGLIWLRFLPLYHLITWLPGISGIRAVARIILIMLAPLSILVALGAEVIWRKWARGPGVAVAILAGLTALLAVEPLTAETRSAPISEWQARTEAVRARLPVPLPRDAILFVRTSDRTFYPPYLMAQSAADLDAMVLGQDLGLPVVNGYSGFSPPTYDRQAGALCPRGEVRLADNARLMGYDERRIAEYQRRLVVIDLAPCS